MIEKTIITMVRPTLPFEQILRATLQDSNLSLRTLGALVRLISMPGDWRWELWYLEEKVLHIGRDARKKIFSELEESGYLIRSRRRDEKGRWIHEYQLFGESQFITPPIEQEKPHSKEKIVDGESSDGKAVDGEGVDNIHNTELGNTELENTKQQPAADKQALAAESASQDVVVSLCDELQKRGVSKTVAVEIVKKYDAERIRQNICYVDKEFVAGKVKDLAAYAVKAIQNDYRPKESPLEKNAREKREAEIKMAQEMERAKAESDKKQKNEYAEKNSLALSLFETLESAEKANLQKLFPDWLAVNNNYAFKELKVKGMQSKKVKSYWLIFLREKMIDREV